MKNCVLPISIILLSAANSMAASLIQDLALQHNAIILGDLNVDSADTEGRQLVTGNFETNIPFLYSVGQSVIGSQNAPSAGRDDLIVGGNYTNVNAAGGVIVTEDAVVGGTAAAGITFNAAEAGVSSGAGTLTSGGGPLKIDRSTGNVTTAAGGVNLSDLSSSISSESFALSQLSNTSNISFNLMGAFQLDVTATGDAIHVINLTPAEWLASDFLTRNISASAGSTIIINVSGTNVDIPGGSMALSGGITQNRILVNYHEATTWTSSLFTHEGTVLAPNTTTASISGGSVNGVSILGGDVTKTGAGEFHNFLFTGDLSVIPEPSSVSLLFAGLFGLTMIRRRNS